MNASKIATDNPSVCLQVKNMSVVDELLHQPFHIFTHPTYGTSMRMMNHEESFDVSFEEHVIVG